FFSLLSRPLSFTLFPYTTLFRSRVFFLLGSRSPMPPLARYKRSRSWASLWWRSTRWGISRAPRRCRTPGGNMGDNELPDHLATLDRKSTRLNSSHVAISYAVFCL